EVYKKSIVTKLSATDTKEGFESVFVDEQTGSRDTIRILIPGHNNEAIAKEEPKSDSTNGTKRFLEIDPDTRQMNRPDTVAKKDQQVKWWPFGNPFAKKDKKPAETQSATKSQSTGSTGKEVAKSQASTKSPSTEKNAEPKKWNPFAKN